MNARQLGRDGFQIGEVGLGCWQFGGDFGPLEEETAMAILAEALEQGIHFWDTADVYGMGRSESLIGAFLKSTRAPVRIATKFGRAPGVYPDQIHASTLRASVEGSLKRLGRDRLDLIQLHCIPRAVLEEGAIFDALRGLQDEGLILHFGASVETVEEARICLRQEGLLSLQIIFNVFREHLATDLFPQARAAGVGLIVRLPLASGLLAGKWTAQTRFAEQDHRTYNADGQRFSVGETFSGIPLSVGLELVELIRPWVPEGMSMAAFSQRWILDHEEVSVIIPGASSPAQLCENASVSGLPPLPAEVHEALAGIYETQVRPHIRGAL